MNRWEEKRREEESEFYERHAKPRTAEQLKIIAHAEELGRAADLRAASLKIASTLGAVGSLRESLKIDIRRDAVNTMSAQEAVWSLNTIVRELVATRELLQRIREDS